MTLIGAMMAAGFGAATYLSKFQTMDNAREVRGKLEAATARVDAKADRIREDVESLKFVNVRVELGQRQIQDQLELLTLQNKSSTTREDRRVMEELEEKTKVRGAALKKSYEEKPVVQAGKANIDPEDPLAKADRL